VHPDIKKIGITASTSPFAGAGKNMCNLMVDLLKQDSTPFVKPAQAFEFTFPEAKMFQLTHPFINLRTFYKTTPSWISSILYVLLKTKPLNVNFIENFTAVPTLI